MSVYLSQRAYPRASAEYPRRRCEHRRNRQSSSLFIALVLCWSLACSSATKTSTGSENTEENLEVESAVDAWYNTRGIRTVFGDFDQTSDIVVSDPELAAKLLSRGNYLAHGPAACGGCHGRDPANPDSPLSGGRQMTDRFGVVSAANITMDAETGIGKWNLGEIVRALRASIDRRGQPLSIEAHSGYRWMSDRDARSIATYLLAQDAVANPVVRRRLGGFERNRYGLIPQHSEVSGYVPVFADSIAASYGRYLALHVSRCSFCHSGLDDVSVASEPVATTSEQKSFWSKLGSVLTFSLFGDSDEPKDMGGVRDVLSKEALYQYDVGDDQLKSNNGLGSLPSTSVAFPEAGPDIRGSSPTGLADWTTEDIVSYLTVGTAPDGRTLDSSLCPWRFYSRMSAKDKDAIAQFLKSH